MRAIIRHKNTFLRVAGQTPTQHVFHVTDTEGHAQFLTNSVKNSRIVTLDHKFRLDFKPGIDNPYFIFGGDLTDRGVGDIQLTESLLEFKLRYPANVILLVGNREASKARFHIELNPIHIRQRLLKGTVPFWLSATPHKLPIDYVKAHMVHAGASVVCHDEIESYIDSLSIKVCQIIYLKWMLTETLGCPHTFHYHAIQLANQRQCGVEAITDEDVLDSMMRLTSPKGLFGQYLRQTQIAAIIPGTSILAVHGGLTPENIGRLPIMAKDQALIENIHHWVDRFNAWFIDEVEQWHHLKLADLPFVEQPARTTLDTFSIRMPSEYRSIVTASMLGEHRQFIEPSRVVSDYLIQNGIQMVLSGHQPCGDHPALLRSQDNRVLFINGDTGYANIRAKEIHNTRGKVSHTLDILVQNENLIVNIDATLESKERVYSQLTITPNAILGDDFVGKIIGENELVQCRLSSNLYRTIRQNGFNVCYQFRTANEIEALLIDANRSAQLARLT